MIVNQVALSGDAPLAGITADPSSGFRGGQAVSPYREDGNQTAKVLLQIASGQP
ncbi:MAG: hypothetical protein WA873_16230 [Jannaschia helgolandensis]